MQSIYNGTSSLFRNETADNMIGTNEIIFIESFPVLMICLPCMYVFSENSCGIFGNYSCLCQCFYLSLSLKVVIEFINRDKSII